MIDEQPLNLREICRGTNQYCPAHGTTPRADMLHVRLRPVYIVHGIGDAVAPPDAGRQLYEAANDPRFLWEVENAGHLMIYLDNPRPHKRRLPSFFDEWLLK